MLYKVTVGRDVYVGTPEEILGFMARAEGAPTAPPPTATPSPSASSPPPSAASSSAASAASSGSSAPSASSSAPSVSAGSAGSSGSSDRTGGLQAYMDGVAARLATHGKRVAVDVGSPLAFLESLAAARLLRLERRRLPREDRVDPKVYLGDQPIAFGADVDEAALRRDLFDED